MFIGFVIYFLSLVFSEGTDASLLEPRRRCVPTATIRGPCHLCVCTTEGVFHCRAYECREDQYNINKVNENCEPHYMYRENTIFCTCSSEGLWQSDNCQQKFRQLLPKTALIHHKLRTNITCTPKRLYLIDCNICQCQSNANVTQSHHDLPEIRDGESCIYGRSYKMDCNICWCGYNNSLLCTKMGCLSGPKGTRRQRTEKEKGKAVKKGIKNSKQELITLPKGPCIPGKFYKKDCRKCFCTDKKVGVCSNKKNACGPPKNMGIVKPDDVRPPIYDDEFVKLPVLDHSAVKCEPGKAYKVDCNPCLCQANLNLLCDKLLCISQRDIRRIAAMKQTGLPCNYTKTVTNNCIKCNCNGTIQQCDPIDDCVTESERKLKFFNKIKNGSRVALNYKKEKCLPNFVYRDDCNKCYCQQDRSLRCTQKTCLNYLQVQKLEKQREYLQKHGL